MSGRLAVDCRMAGKSGIGTYISEILPYMLAARPCLLLGSAAALAPLTAAAADAQVLECAVAPFSVQELFHFPGETLKRINTECRAYYTPYCNIPGGIKVPVYSTIHDIVFLDVPGLASRPGTIARRLLYQRAISRSAELFTVSEFSKNRIMSRLSCAKPVTVTYNAVPRRIAEAPAQNVPKDGSILFVGNIKKHKGLSVLLDGFRQFLEEYGGPEKPVLKIVGNADNFRTKDYTIGEKIKNFPAGSVAFTGFVDDETLLSLYHAARLLVQPSLYEGFGIPPLEALYCGTNAVLSDIPVFKEIYKDFPVSFFKSGDAASLAQAIAASYGGPAPTREQIPARYSYRRSAEIILGRIGDA